MKWKAVGAWACVVAIVSGCDPIESEPPTKVALEDAEAVLETSYCERMFACDCETRLFESVEACMDHVRMQIAALEQPPDIDGVVYDPYCLGEKVEAFDELACASVDDEIEPQDEVGCSRPCLVYHGEVGKGQPCRTTADAVYSSCAKRWRCDVTDCTGDECSGVCVDPCAWAPDDEAPLRELGDSCTGHTQCASGFCPTGTCARPPALGDACAEGGQCGAGAQCDPATSTCEATDALLCSTPSDIR